MEDISESVVETGISAKSFSSTHATSWSELVKPLSIFYLNSKLIFLAFPVLQFIMSHVILVLSKKKIIYIICKDFAMAHSFLNNLEYTLT